MREDKEGACFDGSSSRDGVLTGGDLIKMDDINSIFTPGMRVRHPDQPDWGVGQVQSNIGGRITVNFPDEGKVVIDGSRVYLVPVFDP